MKKLHKTALKYNDWKSKNNPTHKPWLDNRIDLPLHDPKDLITENEEDKQVVDEDEDDDDDDDDDNDEDDDNDDDDEFEEIEAPSPTNSSDDSG